MPKIVVTENQDSKVKKEFIFENIFNFSFDNALFSLLNYADDNDGTIFFVDDKEYKLSSCFQLIVNVKGAGKFFFVFENKIEQLEDLKNDLIKLRDISYKEEDKLIEKITSMFSIINKYNPLFCYTKTEMPLLTKINQACFLCPCIFKESKPAKLFVRKNGKPLRLFSVLFKSSNISYLLTFVSIAFVLQFFFENLFNKSDKLYLFSILLVAAIGLLSYLFTLVVKKKTKYLIFKDFDICALSLTGLFIGLIVGGVLSYFIYPELAIETILVSSAISLFIYILLVTLISIIVNLIINKKK